MKSLLDKYINKYPSEINYFKQLSEQELEQFDSLSLEEQNIKLKRISDAWHQEKYNEKIQTISNGENPNTR